MPAEALPHRPAATAVPSLHLAPAPAAGWTFGDPVIDRWLPSGGLDAGDVVEIKPSTPADATAALTLALLMAGRRMRSVVCASRAPRTLLWCRPARLVPEWGRLYGPGLSALGLDVGEVVVVETANAADTLWAIEEGLRSRAVAVVVGALDTVALTPARRLAIAAQAHRTPALLLTGARSPATAATQARWQVARARAAPHALDPNAPGAARFRLQIARCRGTRADLAPPSFLLEWSHDAYSHAAPSAPFDTSPDAHRFRVVADVGDRAHAAARRA